MIDVDRILSVAPHAHPYVIQLRLQMQRAGIDANDTRAAVFLGQIHVESGGFRRVVESLNYSTNALLQVFGRHRISRDEAARYGRNAHHPANQVALANILYGGEFGRKQLGNTELGDGWKFRGRGLKQLTGRDNYRRFSLAWRGDEHLLQQPEVVEQPHAAVASAVWFWESQKDRGIEKAADARDVETVTELVNGGDNGLDDRFHWTAQYLRAFAA